MRFYHINDTFFQPSANQKKLGMQLISLCREQNVHRIFISTRDRNSEGFRRFLQACKHAQLEVYLPSDHSFYEDEKECTILLSEQSMIIDGTITIEAMDGIANYGDTQKNIYERIYFDFANQDTQEVELFHEISDEIEKIMKDLIKGTNNNKSNLN